MLAQLGGVQFEVAPFNMHENEHEAGASFAEHEVIGRMPPLEFVGEAPESWSISGRLITHLFGGLEALGTLQGMRASGMPQFFMRGDGVPMGWVVIERVRERSTYLASNGVGRVIEFEVGLKRADGPGVDGVFDAMQSLFS